VVSEKAKAYLREKYGDKDFGWDISDVQLKEILTEDGPLNYDTLNEKCTALEKLIKEVEETLERLKTWKL